MKTKTLKYSTTFNCSPAQFYEAFLDPKKHVDFTGFNASINDKVGGKFITCGIRNFGYNLFLEKNKRIIQAWRQVTFPDNVYSIIDIKLTKLKGGKTRMQFVQTGAPESCMYWLRPGWKSTYWEPMKKYLEKGIKQKRRE